MSDALDLATWACFVLGAFFLLAGGIGLLRFPDFFSRLHAGGIIDTMGAYLVLLGLMLQAGFTLTLVKLLSIFFLMLVTSPTSTHALAKAAVAGGLGPRSRRRDRGGADDEETPR